MTDLTEKVVAELLAGAQAEAVKTGKPLAYSGPVFVRRVWWDSEAKEVKVSDIDQDAWYLP